MIFWMIITIKLCLEEYFLVLSSFGFIPYIIYQLIIQKF